jgi:CheY-like chemotaxis protein
MSEQKEILIVEDEEENVIFLAQIVEDHGYRFRIARNGKSAIAALGEKRPDMVLLDIMMPRKSGVHVYNEMKKEPTLAEIPIIIITGASQATGVNVKTGEHDPKESYGDDLARELGSMLYEKVKDLKADALMEKPIEPQLLVEKIRALLE